jgi:gliding motility-associated-like protein
VFCAHAQLVADFSASPTSGCAPLLVTFNDQSTGNPTSWIWDFGNGQLSTVKNPTISYSTPGTYTVRLIVKDTSGIDDTIKTNYITVFPSPSASFAANLTTSCAPATIQFTDHSTAPQGSSIVSWSWNFGDGGTSTQQNPSYTYSNVGFYTVSLQVTSSTGCTSTAAIGRYIRIVNGIDADFAYSFPSTCRPPFTIGFNDLSSGPGNLSYNWNFGNGTSTLQNPYNTFPAAGTYPVTLSVKSNLGCSGTVTRNVVIAGKTTDFTFPSTICVGETVSFQNNSSPSPVSSFWTFSDGTNSSQINPVKTFLSGGTYQVRLINNYGNCSDSITKAVTVISSPTVDFTANDSTGCNAPFTVQFTDKSPAAATWYWDFGDGTSSTQQNPSHTYSSAGDYDVTLSITLSGGCSNVITKKQYIKIHPAAVSILNAPAGGCIPFTYSPVPSVQSVDSITSYSWDFGDGTTSTQQLPTHTYNTAGNYTIQLTITAQTGCTKTISIPNGVLAGTKPTANFSFTPNNSCASSVIQFTDMSVTTPGANVQWIWEFGDGQTSPLQNPTHVYQDTGVLTIKLTVLNNGCADIITKTITVLPPVAKFGFKTDCINHLNVTFSDSSLANAVYGPVTYQWDFGDGSTSTVQSPSHAYSALGAYSVTLTVTNGLCSYSKKQTINLVNEPVNFSINKNPVCKNEVFTLSAVTANPANIKTYTWKIDTATISSSTPTVNYHLPNYGLYDVTLTMEDINGCTTSKTITKYITISGPVAKFSAGVPGGCINNQINFNDLSTPATAPITQWTWNFGDGTIQTFTAPPFSHTYSQPGNYSVSLTIKDTATCSDVSSLSNVVLVTDPIAAFRADTFYCPKAPLQFTDTSAGIGLTYAWDFGDGGISTLQNPTHSYIGANTSYTVKLRIKDIVGCEDSITKTQYVRIGTPKASFGIVDSSGICLPVVTSFTIGGTDYNNYYWDFGDGTTSTALNPSHFYNFYGSYTPKLFAIGPGGCMDSAQATVNVYDPNVAAQINPSATTACNSLNVNFSVTTPPGFKYVFYFGDGKLDSSGQTTLTHLYPSPGNFTPYLVLTDKFGCDPAKYATTVHVYGALPLFDKSKKQFCDSGSVLFTNYTLTNDPITSTTWDFGDGTTSTAVRPLHFYSSPGTYTARLIVTTLNNCTSIYSDTIRVYQTPVVSIAGKDTICINSTEGFSGVLTAPDSTIQWQWNFGNGSTSQIQNPTVLYSSAGNYNIQLLAANKLGCSDTAVHPVVVVPLPTATPVSNPVTIISGASAQLNMNYTGAIVSYNWLPPQHLSCTDCPQPVANPQFTTDYHISVIDRFGCKNSGNVTVKVICNGQNFFVPNTFTPNGDGVNDVFYLRGTGLFRVNSIMIFDRWGEVVFEKKNFQVNDPAAGWDGTFRGKKAKADVYVYQLEIVCDNGDIMKYSGNIALIQ